MELKNTVQLHVYLYMSETYSRYIERCLGVKIANDLQLHFTE